ncbi:uncharacterized protein LOC128336293 isoform X7 [Hemicordylus capensis]|uniref:uncharacterized protein LOC128336293 isoform X7 n=1 Tax=Hemicordylus capensis TaxID=884348 RepID=UPI002304131F|nr:uncharacterized protein LOC128336293 isoform X7 [Hemicordylus capensis]
MRAELGPAPLPLPSPLPPLPSPSPPPLFPLSPSPSSSSPTFILSSSPLSSFLPFLLPLQSVTEERAGCFASIVLEPEQLLLAFWASAAFSRRSDPCMSVTQAMEWLIEERDNRIVDAPLPGQLLLGNSAEAGTSSSTTTTTKAVAGASLEASREELKDELTELFKKIRRKREFRADPQAVIALMEMGYDEREVVDALRGNNHQQNTVCEWLLGDRKPTPEDVDQGIDPSSPLFQAILENPVVQLRLTNPKTLLGQFSKKKRSWCMCPYDPQTGVLLLEHLFLSRGQRGRNGVGACVPTTSRPECSSWSIFSSQGANVADFTKGGNHTQAKEGGKESHGRTKRQRHTSHKGIKRADDDAQDSQSKGCFPHRPECSVNPGSISRNFRLLCSLTTCGRQHDLSFCGCLE